MPIVRAQVSIPRVGANTEDTVTNTWHFSCVDTSEGVINEVQTDLVAFYETLDAFKSDIQDWVNARVKWFDLSEPEPRVPFEDEIFGTSSASATDPLPHEVACCVSFHGEYVSGASQARRRGRIYFGPLNTTVMATTGYFASGLLSTVVLAGGNLLTDSNASSNYAWVVYSPTSGQSYPVVGGWVDNAPDIQRRRGWDATSTSTF